MRDGTFDTDVDLTGVNVSGKLEMDGSTFRGEKLSINGGVVGSELFMRDGTFETDVEFIGSRVEILRARNDELAAR